MTPPVRGRDKLIVAGLMLAAAATAAGLAGFAAGAAWEIAGLPPLGAPGSAAVVLMALAADAAYSRLSRPRPWSVGRQVPREWSRLFSARTVAVLYGARLGVGPLTILPTWLWWAATAVGASAGVWHSVAVAVAFAAVRVLVMVGLAQHIASAAAPRMARIMASEPRARASCAAVGTLVCAVMLIW
ncbi:MAG TPA: hypothetical protein VML96_03805 [Egibacteraceae bacterium]|nr:hypothetical protein [Egibacteraceae bacterium]